MSPDINPVFERTKTEESDTPEIFRIGEYTFNAPCQTLQFQQQECKITATDAALLKMLCLNKNSILERKHALETIWHEDTYFTTRSMDWFVTKLRKYLLHDPNVKIINVRGRGYKLMVK